MCNFCDKATICLKNLQTEMTAIGKVSFAYFTYVLKTRSIVSEFAGSFFIHFSALSITEVLIATSKYFRFSWLFLLIKDRVSLRQSCLLCEGHARGQAK